MKNIHLNKININTLLVHMVDYITMAHLSDDVYLGMHPIAKYPCGVKGYRCEIIDMEKLSSTLTVKFGGDNKLMEFFTI